MSNRLKAGFSIHGQSSLDFNLLLTNYSFPTPELREIRETIPFMDGSYDFSFLYGNQNYDDRTVTFQLIAFESDFQKRGEISTKVSNWLIGKPTSNLTTNIYPNYQFQLKCVGIEREIVSYGVRFTITFRGHPLALNINTQRGEVI